MKSIDFFNKLIDECKTVPESKLDKILFYYKEQINKGKKNGYPENEIIKSFGHIDDLITEIINNPDLFIKQHSSYNSDYNNNNSDSKKITLPETSNVNTNSIYTSDVKKNNTKKINIILKILIGILGFTILFPLTTTILGFILGFLTIFVCILFLCIAILFNINNLSNLHMFPDFLLNLPKESLTYFSIGSICFSLFIIIGTISICKFLSIKLKHFYIYGKHREVKNEQKN